MNIERLRKIIEYSKKNNDEIKSKVKNFCSFAGIEYDSEHLNILQIFRPALFKKGFLLLEMPFSDEEIGALCYKGDGLGYVVINTSLSKANVNFAMAHEIYHVFFQNSNYKSKVEFFDDNYYENEEEYAANLFAGMFLMPENSFRRMFLKFKEESGGDEYDTKIRLMSYFQVPFMAVLIRCMELELTDGNTVSHASFDISHEQIKHKLSELWLDVSIMDASKSDDYSRLEEIVRKYGAEYIEKEYISERTVKKVLDNMRKLYTKIKGE